MTKIIEYENRQEISILDESNPSAIINSIQAPLLREGMLRVPAEMLQMDDRELQKLVKPSAQLNRCRLNFWTSYSIFLRTGKKVTVADICDGTVSREFFFGNIVATPKNMAWLLCPVRTYRASLEEALNVGMLKLREIIDANVVDANGNVDTKAAAIVLKAYQLLDDRVNGGVTQKIEQKTLNITKNIDSNTDGNQILIEEEMKALKQQYLESKMKEDPGFGDKGEDIEVISNT